MGNKLVFVSGAPFWFTPEGRFEAAEQKVKSQNCCKFGSGYRFTATASG